MPTMILVHGAFADARAFDAVRPRLEARGWRVVAPDLPGHGSDPTPPSAITLQTYVDAVTAHVRQAAEPVVLVGHSMAGVVVTQVADNVPGSIRALVYAAAYVPRDGESLQILAERDPTSLVGPNLRFGADGATVTVAPEAIGEAVANDLPAEFQRQIAQGQRPEPLAPFAGTVALRGGLSRVPRGYVHTTLDRAVTPALQAPMAEGLPARSVSAGHLPFLSRPDDFVEALLSLVDELGGPR